MERSKFNVSNDTAKRTYSDIVFDSELEMKYYRDVICPGVGSGEIAHYELQKEYTLQPKFRHDGKSVQPILYVADFYVEYSDGHCEVIDTKGCPDSTARIKRKMFWYNYPDISYRWITYVKKWGGWIDYDAANKLRKENKKNKKKSKENVDNGEEGKTSIGKCV